jgi:lipopolysaccharide/colanic/teichoic acid biosynthesis glycosyltransferase
MEASTSTPAAGVTAAVAGPAAAPEAAPELIARRGSAACRALDIVVSAILLILLMPLFLVIGLIIRLDSEGPAIFRQRRIGRDQDPFTVMKFRTMYAGVGHDTHRAFVERLIAGDGPGEGDGVKPSFFKIARDPRVTRAGHVLRKSSLDELPQLWNVLRGEMSLVGPRPCLQYELEAYPTHWFGRFAVKPGISGLWQVGGRSELTLEEMIELDLEYARTRSFWVNVKILLRTIPVVLNGRGAA